MLRRRFICTKIPKSTTPDHHLHNHHQQNQNSKWTVKQVKKSNFEEALVDFKKHIHDSDFIAMSLQKTGSHSAPWHRVLPIDTAETAYFKAKYAAERFQVLQFAVCPFSIRASKVFAHPYNFHLFPRDELKIGMPSYSFSCQSSYLSSMAREGFDFNVCIYDGISYLSRAQELAAKVRMGNPVSNYFSNPVTQSSSAFSVADSVFLERIKSRVKHWISACRDSNRSDGENNLALLHLLMISSKGVPFIAEALIRSLRKLVVGSEEFGSRPSLSIDVCSERQVQLALEMLRGFSDDVVPMFIPAKGGGTQAVRVVLTNSKEDRNLFENERKIEEEEQNKRLRGFREVIDVISTSQKPVVAHNSLNGLSQCLQFPVSLDYTAANHCLDPFYTNFLHNADFACIHTKFLSPLPPTLEEFTCSLRLVFPHILDVNHLMKEIVPSRKLANLSTALSYLQRRFFAPIDMEISHQGKSSYAPFHAVHPVNLRSQDLNSSYEDHIDGDIRVWNDNSKKVSSKDLVFLWGFRRGLSAGWLKSLLCGSHEAFSKEFDVRLVDQSCAVVVFLNPGLSESFLGAMDCGEIYSENLTDLISDGLRAADYETYQRVLRLGLWEAYLADSFDKALADPDSQSVELSKGPGEIYWDSDLMINLDEL
ncbi:hypothetical protein RJ639_035994 [Escallonia herrerae]|uniref:Uncharacterized protein n=1 Tax=Escallonia herrerae TaxID=1293975 RepID=A0AA88WQ62_9ASTE|nr:hypothetical protein RJ639_035994 [Escallonia herrerae]